MILRDVFGQNVKVFSILLCFLTVVTKADPKGICPSFLEVVGGKRTLVPSELHPNELYIVSTKPHLMADQTKMVALFHPKDLEIAKRLHYPNEVFVMKVNSSQINGLQSMQDTHFPRGIYYGQVPRSAIVEESRMFWVKAWEPARLMETGINEFTYRKIHKSLGSTLIRRVDY